MSFPLPLRIAQKLPVRNSWELIIKKLPIPLPILYYFEVMREVLANTLCLQLSACIKVQDSRALGSRNDLLKRVFHR